MKTVVWIDVSSSSVQYEAPVVEVVVVMGVFHHSIDKVLPIELCHASHEMMEMVSIGTNTLSMSSMCHSVL